MHGWHSEMSVYEGLNSVPSETLMVHSVKTHFETLMVTHSVIEHILSTVYLQR